MTREHANEADKRGLTLATARQKRFLTPSDIADELSVSIRTAYRLAEDIGATRIGKLVRVARKDFEKWLNRQSPFSGDLEATSITHGFPTRARGDPSASRPGVERKATRSPGDSDTSALSKIRPVRRRGPSLSKAS
jgi:excisionase family DNA binding protein